MHRVFRHFAIGVMVCLGAAAAQAQIILYEHADFKGRSIRGSGTIPKLSDRGFNDLASSAKVLTGTWEVCDDADFGGKCVVLQPGQYRVLGDIGLNDRVSSVRSASDGQGGRASGSGSNEYKRGYNDGSKGRPFDNDRHPQDYKDGFRAGEDARSGSSGPSSSAREYSINRLSDGGFEVVWPQRGCIGSFNSRGEPLRFNESCNDDLISRSREIARRER